MVLGNARCLCTVLTKAQNDNWIKSVPVPYQLESPFNSQHDPWFKLHTCTSPPFHVNLKNWFAKCHGDGASSSCQTSNDMVSSVSAFSDSQWIIVLSYLFGRIGFIGYSKFDEHHCTKIEAVESTFLIETSKHRIDAKTDSCFLVWPVLSAWTVVYWALEPRASLCGLCCWLLFGGWWWRSSTQSCTWFNYTSRLS